MLPGTRGFPLLLLGAVALLGGCNRPDSGPGSREAAASTSDSLAVTGPDGLQVWFTLVRSAHSAGGTRCTERGLEIRRGSRRIQVPLLYTGEAPILLNDSTMRAILWTNCRPVTPYLVDLRTGQPVPERRSRTP